MRPSCAKLAEVKVFFVLISTARMVVQTCHVAFWNRCVKLHLTYEVKGQNPNAHFGRHGAKKKVCQYSDI